MRGSRATQERPHNFLGHPVIKVCTLYYDYNSKNRTEALFQRDYFLGWRGLGNTYNHKAVNLCCPLKIQMNNRETFLRLVIFFLTIIKDFSIVF